MVHFKQSPTDTRRRWLLVAVYGFAMAWVESAVVHYLRAYISRQQPYQPNPLLQAFNFGQIEVIREAATLIMLLVVGWLAGRNHRERWGYFLLAFGVWDIAYYIFLHVMGGWPASIFDWDILFLIPLPWWGPVWAPAAVSTLMIAFGMLITHGTEPPTWPSRRSIAAAVFGIFLALYTFMSDAIAMLPAGGDAVRSMLPQSFYWPAFLAAWLLMSAPIWSLAGQHWNSRAPALTHKGTSYG